MFAKATSNPGNAQTQFVSLRKKRTSLLVLPAKIIAFGVGTMGIMIACVLCLTIVGIIPAIPMIWGSLGIIYAALNRQRVACPNCGHKHNYVRNSALNFVCRKCRTLTVVNWE